MSSQTAADAAVDALRDRVNTALRAALKARDKGAIAALRAVLHVIDNAGAVTVPSGPYEPTQHADVPRRTRTRAEIDDLIRAEAEERSTAAATYERLGRAAEAERLHAEAAAVRQCLEF